MEAMIPELLEQFGPAIIPALIVFLISYREIKSLERRFEEHVEHHKEWEKNWETTLCHKIDKIYERLNPLSQSIYRMEGLLEASFGGKNAKSK